MPIFVLCCLLSIYTSSQGWFSVKKKNTVQINISLRYYYIDNQCIL